MQNAWYSGEAMQPPEAADRFPTLVAASDGDVLQLPDRTAHIRLRYRTPELVVIDVDLNGVIFCKEGYFFR